MRYASVAIVGFGLLLCATSLSFASAPKKSTVSASASTSSNKPKASPSQEHIDRGIAAFTARDIDGAMTAFEDAITAEPARAYCYYMLGQVQRIQKKLDDADATFQKGLQRAARDPNTRVKLLFVIADTREQMRRWDDAITAWKAYADFLASAPKLKGYPETATARIQVIERRKTMEVDYGKVRERIQQRERDVEVGK